jgi:hypothetical protein
MTRSGRGNLASDARDRRKDGSCAAPIAHRIGSNAEHHFFQAPNTTRRLRTRYPDRCVASRKTALYPYLLHIGDQTATISPADNSWARGAARPAQSAGSEPSPWRSLHEAAWTRSSSEGIWATPDRAAPTRLDICCAGFSPTGPSLVKPLFVVPQFGERGIEAP